MKKKQITNETEFLEIIDSGKPKTSLGNGLHFLQNRLNDKFFEFRKTIDGKEITNSIGKYPAMSLIDARVKADKLLAEVEASKIEKAERRFRAELREAYSSQKTIKPRTDKHQLPCFKSNKDAKEFISILNRKLPFKPIKNEQSPSLTNYIETEIYAAIWLLLFTPLSIKDFVSANWDQVQITTFNNTEFCNWTLVSNDNKIRCLTLSNRASVAVAHLKNISSIDTSKQVFPHLSIHTEKEIKVKLISSINKDIWPLYKIDPTQFRDFFVHIANEYSAFKPEFIKSYALQNNFQDLCSISQRGLADWWENQLIKTAYEYKLEYTAPGNL